MAQRKTHFCQFIGIFFDKLGLEERELNGLGKEEMLAGDPVTAILPPQVFKEQALMGGVLINNHQAFAVLTEDIKVMELTDDLQVVAEMAGINKSCLSRSFRNGLRKSSLRGELSVRKRQRVYRCLRVLRGNRC